MPLWRVPAFPCIVLRLEIRMALLHRLRARVWNLRFWMAVASLAPFVARLRRCKMDRRRGARSATPARGRSRARSTGPKRKRARSFEELFAYQKKVQAARKAYPKKHADEIVKWMRHCAVVSAAGKTLKDIRAARGPPEEMAQKRDALFAERAEILRCAQVPQQVADSVSKVVAYLGGPYANGTTPAEPAAAQTAEDHYSAWFAALADSTRSSTARAHDLQTQLADNAKTFMGPDASAATSLTQAWAAAEDALELEEKLRNDKSAVAMLCEAAGKAIDMAGELSDYLRRGPEDYGDISMLGALTMHLRTFPELEHDAGFRGHCVQITGLPLEKEPLDTADDEVWTSLEVCEDTVGDFAKLALHARKLATGNAVPVFELGNGKLMAYYRITGINLHGFCCQYEVDSLFLARVFACVSASLARFQQVMGRCHGNVGSANIFVDPSTLNIVLGPHGKTGLVDRRDLQATRRMLDMLANELEVPFPDTPHLKRKVDCSSCFSTCAKSSACPSSKHRFCQDCLSNLVSAAAKQSGASPEVACPLGCGRWADLALLRALPQLEAEQLLKRRRIHEEVEMRRQIEDGFRDKQPLHNTGGLSQKLVDKAIDLLVDKCRSCGQAGVLISVRQLPGKGGLSAVGLWFVRAPKCNWHVRGKLGAEGGNGTKNAPPSLW